jgi:hypothetical protein
MAVIEHARSMQKPISEIPGQVIVIEQIQFVSFPHALQVFAKMHCIQHCIACSLQWHNEMQLLSKQN